LEHLTAFLCIHWES